MQRLLKDTVADTFNAVTIDGDKDGKQAKLTFPAVADDKNLQIVLLQRTAEDLAAHLIEHGAQRVRRD